MHLDLLANSEDGEVRGQGKEYLSRRSRAVVIPPVKVSPLLQASRRRQQGQCTTSPPPPPPINLKFFGISNSKGEKPKAFLSQGDDVWIAHEGDVVNRHYKIVRISPNAVEVEDLLNNNRQSIRSDAGIAADAAAIRVRRKPAGPAGLRLHAAGADACRGDADDHACWEWRRITGAASCATARWR